MRKSIVLTTILLLTFLCSTALAQKAKIYPRRVVTRPATCVAGDFVYAADTKISSICREGPGTWDNVAGPGVGGGITNGAGANVIPKSNGTNLVASTLTDSGTNITSTSNLLFSTDNTKDIGAAGATRPRTGYFGTSVVSPLVQSPSGTDLILQGVSANAAIRGSVVYLQNSAGSTTYLVIDGTSASPDNAAFTYNAGATGQFKWSDTGLARASAALVAFTDGSTGLGGIGDRNGNELLKFTATASAVNELTITNAATGNAPSISATGGDTNIGLTLNPKGNAKVSLFYDTSKAVVEVSNTENGTFTVNALPPHGQYLTIVPRDSTLGIGSGEVSITPSNSLHLKNNLYTYGAVLVRSGDRIGWSGHATYPADTTDTALARASAAVVRTTDGASGGGALATGAASGQPTCNSTNRGAMWTVFAAGGASDTFQVCMKAAADTYAWRTVFTAP